MDKEKIIDILYKRRVTFGFIFGIIFLVYAKPASIINLFIGLVIAYMGEILRLIASGYIIKTDELMKSGPYAMVRHPLYLGSFIMGLGLCVSIFSFTYIVSSLVILVSFMLLFFGVYIPVLKKEEEVLIQIYKDEYLDYKKSVPMLFPKLRNSFKSTQETGFKKEVFLRNKEYRAFIGLALVTIFLIIRFVGIIL